MRVLVTGSEGFLGNHVCRALKERGHQVIGLDVVLGEGMVGRYPDSPTHPGTRYIQADITKLLPVMEMDAIIHLAAVASPNVCTANPEMAFSVNVLGTQQVLRLALESGAKKFVFSSSAHVYGVGPKYLPTDEYHPLYLQNTYTTTKILGEQLCQLFYDNHGLSYTVLRLFNAYGPGQGLGYFIPDMIKQAEGGVVGLGGHDTTKDWVYVDDVARAFCLAVETPYAGVMNIGTGEQTQIGAIAQKIASELGAKFTCSSTGHFTRMQADWSRAKRVLGWEPTVSIWEGLSAVLSDAKVRSLVS